MIDQTRLREAMALHTAGQLQEAWSRYESLRQAFPDDPDVVHLMGVLAGQAGNLQESVRLIETALRMRPKSPDFHKNLGITWQRLEDKARAAACFLAMGDVLCEETRFDEAVTAYVQAFNLDPRNEQVANNLGATLNRIGRHAEARDWLMQAMRPDPNIPPILAQWDGGNGPEGFLRQNPSLHLNYGNALCGTGAFEDALRFYGNTLKLKPESVEAHGNLALTLLLLGRYEEGWDEFEWRWHGADYKRATLSRPLWNGESPEELGGKLLILGEQGYGDAIQFLRFVPMLADRGHDILLEVKPELMTLFSQGFHHDRVTLIPSRAASADVYDDLDHKAYTGMLGLPRHLGITLDNLPAHTPYIGVSEERLEHWRQRFESDRRRLKIGIAWGGNPNHPRNFQRSIPATFLHPLLDRDDVTFYSLQKGPAARWPFPHQNFVVLDHELPDFADTAAAMRNLDLVITADTATAHLAAASNVLTWIMVTKVPDWRWLLDRADSPWYPSVRLFRQQQPNDWPAVIADVRQALDSWLA